jgi:DNA-3-methyladenine glycosylase
MKLPISFYERPDVVQIAKELLGKVLVTNRNGTRTSGRIVETEAYRGIADRASHAYGGRRTSRNEPMYAAPGIAYIYLCYGVHHLFNVVTNKTNIPHAVLIRALEPVEGIEKMLKRRTKKIIDHSLTRGPGNLSKALGIHTKYSGESLYGNRIFIEDDGFLVKKNMIASSRRIGVEYAGKDARLPYRFFIKENPFVSGKRTDAKI